MDYLFEIAFSIFSVVFATMYKNLSRKFQQEKSRNEYLYQGLQCLMREQIINNYNKYTERGECPIYAKESVDKLYKAYHSLGGNGMVTELYEKMMEMEEKK